MFVEFHKIGGFCFEIHWCGGGTLLSLLFEKIVFPLNWVRSYMTGSGVRHIVLWDAHFIVHGKKTVIN